MISIYYIYSKTYRKKRRKQYYQPFNVSPTAQYCSCERIRHFPKLIEHSIKLWSKSTRKTFHAITHVLLLIHNQEFRINMQHSKAAISLKTKRFDAGQFFPRVVGVGRFGAERFVAKKCWKE